MIQVEGTPIRYDTRAKERTLYKELDKKQAELDEAYDRIDKLIRELSGANARINEMNIILKAARKKTRHRKIWKTKEAEGIK